MLDTVVNHVLSFIVGFALTLSIGAPALAVVTALLWRLGYGDSWEDIWFVLREAFTRPLMKTLD